MALKNIKANETPAPPAKKPAIIGTFEGKCADANVENANGMYLGSELWNTIFHSEEYKIAIKLGHYIGFLGHPEDPGCMDFKDACIVMKDGHLADDGQVYGSFDLIDTPVGRIVKTFIDGGVTFGISVRGAGDIATDGEVDPKTFVFRGFDLVAFPAYSDAVPTFTEIAASSNIELQKKYKAAVSAVSENLNKITSSTAIDEIKKQFNPKSHIYMDLVDRQKAINASEETIDISDEKVSGVMDLYLSQVDACNELKSANENLISRNSTLASENDKLQRILNSMKRIMSSQLDDLKEQNSGLSSRYRTVVSANTKLKSEATSLHKRLDVVKASLDAAKQKHLDSVDASKELQAKVDQLTNQNLKYKQKVNANQQVIDDQKAKISDLESKLRETVTAAKNAKRGSSNFDAKLAQVQQQLAATTKILEDYQEAYADLYASAIGVSLSNIPVTASTTVEQLKSTIRGGTNTSGIPANPGILIDEDDYVTGDEDNTLEIVDGDISDLITL